MTARLIDWLFGTVVLLIGVLNLWLVHPVPGVVGILLSLVYFPPANLFLENRFGLSISLVAKVLLGILVVWFTLGVSDLGDMID